MVPVSSSTLEVLLRQYEDSTFSKELIALACDLGLDRAGAIYGWMGWMGPR